MKHRLPLIFFCILLLFTTPLTVSASTSRPIIPVYNPPSRKLPLKLYVHPIDYDYKTKSAFTCPYHVEIVSVFYQVARDFRKAAYRFASDYPKYEKLVLIRFVNASSSKNADIILRIVGNSDGEAYTLVGSRGSFTIEVDCGQGELSDNLLYSTMFHEFLHALGLDHPPQDWTDDGKPELMRNLGDGSFKVYPSSLDLYATWAIYFGGVKPSVDREINITLPPTIPYVMVVPFEAELQQLRGQVEELQAENRKLVDENQKLWNDLKTLHGVVDQKNAEIQGLKDVNKALQQNVTFLLELVKDYGEQNHRLQVENQRLKANLSRLYMNFTALIETCNRSYYEWSARYNRTFDQLVNMTNRYNAAAQQYNSLAEAYRSLYKRHQQLTILFWTASITAVAYIALTGYWFIKERRQTEEAD